MTKTYTIKAREMHFDYNEKTKVFDNHFLDLTVSSEQKNKLYGIIGPSGTGKTTLISILGGQLKPTQGSVEIDGKDIYQINDRGRRELIAMQMQSATSLRGKLRYNMVFGLPDSWDFEDEEKTDKIYSDDYLIEVLKNVGLWHIFADKDGLETLIGEGGLNLSGGQRQRLNFAGLYLRAKYFKPSLILIDEPTSSLDEISELAITKMINELGQNAVTMVVAHRLKTLDEAEAIYDSSLVDSLKEIKFMDRKELMEKSVYYQNLMSGKAVLED